MSRTRDKQRPWDSRPKNVTYLSVMTSSRPVSDAVRAQQFGAYVGSLFAELSEVRGWNLTEFCKAAGISRQTFYRWRRADWSDGSPKAKRVRELHERLGVDPARALAILGLSSAPAPDDPLSLADPDVRESMLAILRRLRDPNESDDERYFIRRSLADLARRPSSETKSTRNRRAG